MTGTEGSDSPDGALDDSTESGLEVDADTVAGGRPPTTRAPLTRDRIVEAAVSYIDVHGLASLSMRRLGTSLGVEAMSLYRYIPGREQVLDAVADYIVDEMSDESVEKSPEESAGGLVPTVAPAEHVERGWQNYLQHLAHNIRRVALTHPKAFPLVASRPVEAPWLRPPLRSLRWVESFLDALSAEGFSDTALVESYRAFTSFLLGHLLLEVAARGADLGPLDITEEDPEKSLRPYPHVRRLSGQLREDHAETEFEDALENLLQRLALIRAES
jgi:AcrR family transcriptional regulator